MPKKLNSNPKALEARERKDSVKKEKQSAAVKAADDAKWADEGQSATERRAAEKEKKRLEELKRKEQKKEAAAREEAEMKAVKTVKVNPYKVTIAQIQSTVATREKEREKERVDEEKKKQRLLTSHDELPTENKSGGERAADGRGEAVRKGRSRISAYCG